MMPNDLGYCSYKLAVTNPFFIIQDQLTPEGSTQMSTGAVLFAGGAAGMANWAVAIPPDTLKTRFQTDVTGQYKGVADVYR